MLLSGEHELKSSFVGAMDLKDLHVSYKVGMFSGIQCENLQVALQETDWGGVTCGSSAGLKWKVLGGQDRIALKQFQVAGVPCPPESSLSLDPMQRGCGCGRGLFFLGWATV